MAAPSKPSLGQAQQTSGALPDLPAFAPQLVEQPGGQATNQRFQEWWSSLKYRLLTTQNGNQQALLNIEATFNSPTTGFQAQINEEKTVRAAADGALATSITSLSATVSDGFTTLSASVTAVASALATSNGYLEGKYTLTVAAGNVVTGMNITSASGPGTNISSVIFQASEFKIYNGTSGIPAFSLVGSNLTINGSITLSNTQVSGLGSLATASSVDYDTEVSNRPINRSTGAILYSTSPSGSGLFLGSDHMGYYASGAWKTYMDSSGNFALSGSGSNGLTWNGSTLAIDGVITSTSGTIGGYTLSSTGFSSTFGGNTISLTQSGYLTLSSATSTYLAIPGAWSIVNSSVVGINAGGTGGAGNGFLAVRDGSGTATISLIGATGAVTAASYSGITAGMVSGLASSATTDTTNAANITSGFLPAARLIFSSAPSADVPINGYAMIGGLKVALIA